VFSCLSRFNELAYVGTQHFKGAYRFFCQIIHSFWNEVTQVPVPENMSEASEVVQDRVQVAGNDGRPYIVIGETRSGK
jgi:hypothetical protein